MIKLNSYKMMDCKPNPSFFVQKSMEVKNNFLAWTSKDTSKTIMTNSSHQALRCHRIHYVQVKNCKTNLSPALYMEIDRYSRNGAMNQSWHWYLTTYECASRHMRPNLWSIRFSAWPRSTWYLREHKFYGYLAMYIFSNIQVMVTSVGSILVRWLKWYRPMLREFEGIMF